MLSWMCFGVADQTWTPSTITLARPPSEEVVTKDPPSPAPPVTSSSQPSYVTPLSGPVCHDLRRHLESSG